MFVVCDTWNRKYWCGDKITLDWTKDINIASELSLRDANIVLQDLHSMESVQRCKSFFIQEIIEEETIITVRNVVE
jgi:hypothetical protein